MGSQHSNFEEIRRISADILATDFIKKEDANDDIKKAITKLQVDIEILENQLRSIPKEQHDRCLNYFLIKDMIFATRVLNKQLNK